MNKMRSQGCAVSWAEVCGSGLRNGRNFEQLSCVCMQWSYRVGCAFSYLSFKIFYHILICWRSRAASFSWGKPFTSSELEVFAGDTTLSSAGARLLDSFHKWRRVFNGRPQM